MKRANRNPMTFLTPAEVLATLLQAGQRCGGRHDGRNHHAGEQEYSMKSPNILHTIAHTGLTVLSLSNWKDGAGDRDRTGDIQLGKLAFYR